MNIRRVFVRGKELWRVDFGVQSGKRRRAFFHSEAQAKKAVSDQEKRAGLWTTLPAHRQIEIVNILEEMERVGTNLRRVWEAYQDAPQKPQIETMPLREAISEFITAKRGANRRESYVEAIERTMIMFCKGRETQPIHTVSAKDIVDWAESRDLQPQTVKTAYARFSSLFTFAVKRGWVTENPVSKLESIADDLGPPEIWTVAEVERIFRFCHKNMQEFVTYFALGTLAGIRPFELERISKSDIDIERGRVTITAAASKVRQQRIVDLEPSCIAWLKAAGKKHSYGRKHWNLKRHRARIIAQCNVKWSHDIMRHTYASYALALHQDTALISWRMGNSVDVLMKHYRQLVTPEDAQAFWAIIP